MDSRHFLRSTAVWSTFAAAACAADAGDGPKSTVTTPPATFDAGLQGESGGGESGGSGTSGSSSGAPSVTSAEDASDAPLGEDATPLMPGTDGGDETVAPDATDATAPPPPPSCPSCPLQVDYFTADAPDGGMGNPSSTKTISFQLAIANKGSMPQALSELKVRYWFTADGVTSLTMKCYYAQLGMDNVESAFQALSSSTTPAATSMADTYLEISFAAAAGDIAPGADTGQIQVAIFDPTYMGVFNEYGDYSFDASDTPANCKMNDMNSAPSCPASTITLYRNGVLAWGTEPGGASAASGDL